MTKRKTPERARVRVLTSFNLMRKGDEAETLLSPVVQGWINLGFVEVVPNGADPAGPGGAEPDDHERVQDGAEGGFPAGGEPGESFGAGGYGASA